MATTVDHTNRSSFKTPAARALRIPVARRSEGQVELALRTAWLLTRAHHLLLQLRRQAQRFRPTLRSPQDLLSLRAL